MLFEIQGFKIKDEICRSSISVIYKDICPRNILYKTSTNELKIIDFNIASDLTRDVCKSSYHKLEGSLDYMSPEQTGRLKMCLKYRVFLP
ncbi:MAG: protein kinase [Oligoflexales bacterium]|nr:protein kinase [Oligoflexales bacterium]